MSSIVQIFGKLPRLEDRFDFGDESRQFFPIVCICPSGFDELDELFADQVVECWRHTKFEFEVTSRWALLEPDFRVLHGITCRQMLLGVVQEGFRLVLIHQIQSKVDSDVAESESDQGPLLPAMIDQRAVFVFTRCFNASVRNFNVATTSRRACASEGWSSGVSTCWF